MKMQSPCEKVIRRDITRTYPEHDLFKEEHGLGQESLFNVIKVRLIDGSNEWKIDRFRPIHCMTVKWAIVKVLAF